MSSGGASHDGRVSPVSSRDAGQLFPVPLMLVSRLRFKLFLFVLSDSDSFQFIYGTVLFLKTQIISHEHETVESSKRKLICLVR